MSLYRKYRSQKFSDVIGQEHIVQTLKGALISGMVGHAYIFSGMRGTGKTSVARIFAKVVNCLQPENGEPCEKCNICLETSNGSLLDLIEIDAASNRGIDDIRDLREKIKFSPNIGKYKIYIIDEVHMLTPDAFNALLKTLEEPPAHAIFILATTEIHKVPATILSRCQRLDFHKINSDKMFEGIKNIANKEEIKIDEKSIRKIVSLSEGSMRDALSLLDQVSAFSHGGDINFSLLGDILGVANEDELLEFFEAVGGSDVKRAISFINKLVDSGRDVESFIKEGIRFGRKLLILKIGGDVQMDLSNTERAKNIIDRFSLDSMVKIIEVLSTVLKNTKFSFMPQLFFEIEIIKFFQDKDLSISPGGVVLRADEENGEKRKRSILNIIRKENKEEPPEELKNEKRDHSIESKSLPAERVSSGNSRNNTQVFLDRIKEEKVMLYTFICTCVLTEKDDVIEIVTNNPFCFNSLSEKNNFSILRKIAEEVFGKNRDVLILRKEENRGEVSTRDPVSDMLSVFGGELID